MKLPRSNLGWMMYLEFPGRKALLCSGTLNTPGRFWKAEYLDWTRSKKEFWKWWLATRLKNRSNKVDLKYFRKRNCDSDPWPPRDR